ncbi:MAG: DUF1549 domain-containing protein [Verrucomicrobiales bacterium]
MFPLHFLATLTVIFGLSVQAWAKDPWPEVKAILSERCTKCHGGVKHKGGLDLRAIPNILRGGENGPAAIPGNPAESLLIQVLHEDGDPSMPPKGDRVPADEIAKISQWILSLTDATNHAEETIIPEGMPPHVVIDFLIARRWQELQVTPSHEINDATFVRRVYLDLLGRISTTEEQDSFLKQTSSAKRDQLIKTLLEHSESSRHFAEIFDTVFLGRQHGLIRGERSLERQDDWHAYLRWAFKTNRPWNVVAHDLLDGKFTEDKARGARWYLAAHKDKHEDMVRTIAPTLLGKQIACAQCHNHPIIPEIEQRHYWGLVAFLNRSFNVETPEGLAVGEAAAGGDLKFSSLEGESYEAALAFLSGETVEEPHTDAPHDASLYHVPPSKEYFERIAKKDDKEKDKKKKRRRGAMKMDAAPVPQFSRRQALAEVAIEKYPDFAEAFVNRLWALLLGRGIVHPVDHLDSIHPPSHPELLKWLGHDFSEHGYDVKRLVREIIASRAYQLASIPAEDQRPAEETFACGLVSPLSAEALYRSMLVAGGHVPEASGTFPGIDEKPYREAFAKIYPVLFPETFSPTAAEGMFFTNNPRMSEIIVTTFENLTPEEIVAEAFSQSFGRLPDDEERAASLAYLGDAPDTKRSQSLLWTLIASSEFRFNH